MPKEPLPMPNRRRKAPARRGPQIVDIAKKPSLLRLTGLSREEAQRHLLMYRGRLAVQKGNPLRAAVYYAKSGNPGPAFSLVNSFLAARDKPSVVSRMSEVQEAINAVTKADAGLGMQLSGILRRLLK